MPSNNDNTLWLQRSLNKNAQNQARMAIARTGRALPCVVTEVNGSLVTVSFEVQGGSNPYTLPLLTLPKAESQWMRSPTQIGDVGLTVPADTSLGGINGANAGVATIGVDYGNLSALVWIPVAATSFSMAPSASKNWINGPGGARIGDSTNAVYVDCDKTAGTVTIHAGGKSFVFGSSGFTMSNGIVVETHIHGGVQTGSGDTGGPIA